jgi:hypothetical protein
MGLQYPRGHQGINPVPVVETVQQHPRLAIQQQERNKAGLRLLSLTTMADNNELGQRPRGWTWEKPLKLIPLGRPQAINLGAPVAPGWVDEPPAN